jgi:hypothetical protein
MDIPINCDKPLEGIIAYLTRKHGGNVHEKGIVTLTSKSTGFGGLTNVADLRDDSKFESADQPGQWICWDFGEMCIRPTGYTLRAYRLKSWVVEGSVNGETWTEIDRRMDNQDFDLPNTTTASFEAAEPAGYRFIRLTQVGPKHNNNHILLVRAVEFFGTLLW